MEQELNQSLSKQENIALLVQQIKLTYSGQSTEQVKQAEVYVQNILRQKPEYLQILFKYLKPPFNTDRNFRNACANFIKKVYYKIADDQSIDKLVYIQECYNVLVLANYQDHRIKQTLMQALQFIFNKDIQQKYKNQCCQHAETQFKAIIQNPIAWTIQTIEVLHGLTLVLTAYLNSLVEPIDQIIFVLQVLPHICATSALCAEFILKNIQNQEKQPKKQSKLLFLAANKMFQFLQMATERLLQQQQQIQDQVKLFVCSDSFRNIIYEYLFMLCQQKSIISQIPQLNEAKIYILNIIYTLSVHQYQIQQCIVQLLFLTFFQEQENLNKIQLSDEDEPQQILCKCVAILEDQLKKRQHFEFFNKMKIQFLFTMFTYCQTGDLELSYMNEQVQKFTEMAQQFSQAFTTSNVIKVRVANLIKCFIKQFDEGVSNIVQLCIIFITGSIKSENEHSQILKMAQKAYSNFVFMKFGPRQKLDVAFMVLTVISDRLRQRRQLRATVISTLMVYAQTLQQITDQLILARLIRLVGYFPSAVFFSFIKKLMQSSHLFLLEGVNCFDRISRDKQYNSIFPLMHAVYIEILPFLTINDSIMQRLVNQNYQGMVMKNQKLLISILQKLESIFQDENHGSACGGCKQCQQNWIVCLNMLEEMLKKEKNLKNFQYIQNTFQRIQQKVKIFDLLSDNLISIYCVIISKKLVVQKKVEQFVIKYSDPLKLSQYSQYTLYFKLLNKFIIKSDNEAAIMQIYNNLIKYLGILFQMQQQTNANFAILPQMVHCMGHIVIHSQNQQINHKVILDLVNIVLFKQHNKQSRLFNYQKWIMFLLLHFVCIKTKQVKDLLIQQKCYYPFMLCVFNRTFSCKIERKLVIIALQALMIYENDTKLLLQIIKFGINLLKIQKNHNKLKFKNKFNKARDTDMFGFGFEPQRSRQKNKQDQNNDEMQKQQQQAMQNQQTNRNSDEDSILFKDFKHPYQSVCQYTMFRQRLLSLNNLNQMQITQQSVPGITQILQSEWHKNSVRRVFKIAR